MQLDPNDPNLEAAVFGREVEHFLTGAIGSYLVKRAQNEIDAALNGLREVDPEDAKAVRALQNEAKVAQLVIDWLAEVIRRGQIATQVLEDVN